jgi:arylsulfatase A-like enzyme
MVTRMDRDIGRLVALLKELDLDQHTILFFSSDNGPHREGGHDPNFFRSAGPLRGIKRDLYEGGIRVPMIVRWPGHVPAGRISPYVWAFWDFLPTAAELAGVTPPDRLDGLSVVPELLGRPQRERDYLYWEFYERGFQQAVRMGDWKGIRRRPDGPIELYHLPSDLGERYNVADEHPEVVRRIADIMRAAHVDSPEFPVRRGGGGKRR